MAEPQNEHKGRGKMSFKTPYLYNGCPFYLGEVISSDLVLPVWLTDGYSKQRPLGRLKVMIKEGNIKASRNLSGYYTFVDLPSGTYTVRIESALYFTEEKSTSVPKSVAEEIELTPKPFYPFPNNTTLARGQVLSTAGPLSGAEITVTGKTIKTITDEKGEFVLYFKGIKTEPITIEIKKGADIKTVSTTINEGKTKSLGIINFP